jgi:hypothetical protein
VIQSPRAENSYTQLPQALIAAALLSFHRSSEILPMAAALHLGAQELLRQRRLATAAGLALNP